MKIFYLPDLGEGLPDAEIREWLVKEGDEVKVDQPIVSMETAKALLDVPSPYAGRIIKLYGKPGDIIKTGNPLAGFEGEETAGEDAGTVVGSIEVGHQILQESPTGISTSSNVARSIKATPAVRNLARQLNIDLSKVKPSGPGGTITIDDVNKAASDAGAPPKGYETLHGVRRTMAIKMTEAHENVVPVTLVDDADINHFSEKEDITLRLIHAITAACKKEPRLNAHFHSKTLSYKLFKEINLGIAVDTPEGLYVPVIKNAAALSNEQLRETINSFKEHAKKQDFPREMLQDTTITLSNFGIFAGRYANPIVAPPTVAIIAVGKLRKEVVPVEDKMAIHKIMPLSLTFDHRAITGGEAARFLSALIENLEK